MTMNDPKDDYCEHRWASDTPVRVCLLCGEIRVLPNGDSNPRILWPGRDTKDDPLGLPKFNKACIAGLSKACGIKKLAKLTGIHWKILRAWVGAYCRKPSQQLIPTVQVAPEKKPRRLPVLDQLSTAIPKITLSKLDPGDCQICGGEVLRDSDYKPHYIQTSRATIWLCGVCSEGLANLFEAVEIPYQVVGDKTHA